MKAYAVTLEPGVILHLNAPDAQSAANEAVRQWEWDRAEYNVAAGGSVTVSVSDGCTSARYRVAGEMAPVYRASPADDEEDDEDDAG